MEIYLLDVLYKDIIVPFGLSDIFIFEWIKNNFFSQNPGSGSI